MLDHPGGMDCLRIKTKGGTNLFSPLVIILHWSLKQRHFCYLITYKVHTHMCSKCKNTCNIHNYSQTFDLKDTSLLIYAYVWKYTMKKIFVLLNISFYFSVVFLRYHSRYTEIPINDQFCFSGILSASVTFSNLKLFNLFLLKVFIIILISFVLKWLF